MRQSRAALQTAVILALLKQVQCFAPTTPAFVFTNAGGQQPQQAQQQHRPGQLPHAFKSSTRLQVFGSSYTASLNNRHSSSDWLYNIQSIPQSTILREVRNPVLAVAGWSTVVAVVHKLLSSSSHTAISAIAGCMQLPGTAHSFLVSALGLLLVFRTNSAYQRFLEGRKIWQEIHSLSRSISRMAHLYHSEVGSQRLQRLKNLLAAYPYLLRHHIRPGCLCEESAKLSSIPQDCRIKLGVRRLEPETRYEGDKKFLKQQQQPRKCYVDRRNLPWSLFDSKALPKLARSHNRPLWVCDRLGREIMDIPYGPNFSSRERLSLLGQVDKLTNAVGQCERIHQTAVPLNYARHSLRSLVLWLFTLPFCLVKDMGMLTPLVTALSAWTLFGIYQIGYTIEDPFQGSLRLSILCESIRRDVLGYGNDPNDDRETAYELECDEPDRTSSSSSYWQTAAFSNGTILDSLLQKDLGILTNPPNLLLTEHLAESPFQVNSYP